MEKRREVLSKIAYGSFYLAVIMEVLIVLIDKSSLVNPVEGRLFQITFLLCFIKVCLTKCTWKEYLAIFLFCILGMISYLITGRNEIIRIVMFIAACKDIDIQKCLKLVFWMTLAGSVLIILMSVTGIYGAVSLTQDYGRGGVETRYTLGMGHPNALQCMVWALTTLSLYLYAEKMKWYYYLMLLAVNAFFFFLTDSKTSMLAVMFTMLITYMASAKKSRILPKISALLSGAVTLFSIGISVIIAANAYRVYDYAWNRDKSRLTKFFVKLNELLNGRIRILSGTTRFEGTTSTWRLFSAPENNYFFDMGWVRLFYWYGIIPACIFIFVMFAVMVYCYRKEKYKEIVLIASFALYSIIEAHAVSVYLARNYVLFIIGGCFSGMLLEKKKNE